MANEIEVKGLEELSKRFAMYPTKYNKVITTIVLASMLTLQENVPAYPAKPAGSRYDRRGRLGESLGVSMGGGKSGQPSIFKVRQIGGSRMNIQGRMGTNLRYAPQVIGDRSQQKAPFSSYWWRLEDTADKAAPKINRLFVGATDELAKFIEGK